MQANRVASWDGSNWSALGAGTNNIVEALAIFDGQLIAAGSFTTAGGVSASRIAAWNGSSWAALGSGMNNGINALTVYDGQLIAAGLFSTAGGNTVNRIASWNGSNWLPLSSGASATVSALTVFDGQLIAGGSFTSVSGVAANRIASWNGSSWSALGTGVNSNVLALTVFDGKLIAGGGFTMAGSTPANRIASWNGSSWSAFGSGLNANVQTLAVFNGQLIAAGDFPMTGSTTVTVNRIASWNGSDWSALGSGLNNPVTTLEVFDGQLIAGGSFSTAGGKTAQRIASWNGSAWSALSAGMDGSVNAFGVFDEQLIVSGSFTMAGNTPANRIASWNGSTWSALGSGISGVVGAFTVYSGQLIVGGSFSAAGGTPANNIASWDGNNWSALGTGLDSTVTDLYVFDGELIAGGTFEKAGVVLVNRIARWNGTSWFGLGSGTNDNVNAFTEFDDKLIVSGTFTTAGGVPANRIASWDGSNWSALGAGLNNASNALTVFDGQLIAAGNFMTAGGAPASRIASWNGSNWSALGAGLNNPSNALTVFDGQLIVSGSFSIAGEVSANRIASWDGSNWSALGAGLSHSVSALTVFDGQLIAGGFFTTAGGKYSPYIARLGGSQVNPAQVNLIFDSQGGSAVDTLSGAVGQVLTLPADPTRAHYTFTGWNSASDGTGTAYGKAGDSITLPAGGATFYAQWTANSYTITFNSAGGSAVAPISASVGAAVVAPAAPTREGYTFTGWNPALPATMPAANITVTAQWTANSYTITFNSAGGSTVAPISASFGAPVAAPAAPSREGFAFAGWSPALPATMPAANTTVTAQWIVNSYTITFNSAGGSTLAPISASFGAAVAAPAAPTREGYTFTGWNPALPTTMPAADTTVTAQWTANSYTITFNSAGGSSLAPISASFGAAVAAPAAPSREGYTFAGWNPALPATMPAANSTVTAQWTVNSYTISFDSAGGTAVAPVRASFGAPVTAPAAPTREGYTFAGWSPALPTTMPAQDLTVTALYKPIPLTVTAQVKGEATVSPATQQVDYGSPATVALSLTNPADIVVLSGTCQAAVSGKQIVTAAVKEACSIDVTVYPSTQVKKDSNVALSSNTATTFSFSGGAGAKTLSGVALMRAGAASELAFADAEALLRVNDDGSYVFRAERTGRYTLSFVDKVSGERVEVVYDVLPYLAFSSNQQPVQRDVSTNVSVWLSDEPVEYPVTVSVIKEGVSAEVQRIEFTAEHQLLRSYAVTATATPARIILQETAINNALLGSPAVHNLVVQQQVPALALTATAAQNSTETHVISQTAGLVTLSVSALNNTDATYDWISSDINLDVSGATARFDPVNVPEGRYTITVAGRSATGRQGRYDLALRIIANCPVESCASVSGMPISANKFAATKNRLPICPNVAGENRVGSCQAEGSKALFTEVPNQYQLTLGAVAEAESWRSGQFGVAVNNQTLTDAGFVQQGVVVNFDVLGLDNPGEVVPVAIPLAPGINIPPDAVWRKFIQGQWQDFVVDTANRIDSAARDASGQCPGVSSDLWQSGLTAGHGCVRLTIQDGGPNDDDGVANSIIRDPGVLAVAKVVVPPPVSEPPKGAKHQSGGSMGALLGLFLGGLFVCRQRQRLLVSR